MLLEQQRRGEGETRCRSPCRTRRLVVDSPPEGRAVAHVLRLLFAGAWGLREETLEL